MQINERLYNKYEKKLSDLSMKNAVTAAVKG